MPKNSCSPCPPDNCYKECVESCIEVCKKKCCDRKYRKLACKLLETGLFVDSANFNVARVQAASTSGSYYNILQHFADTSINCVDLEPSSDYITRNQPATAAIYLSQGIWSGVNVYQFTKEEWSNFNRLTPLISNFLFTASPVVKYIFGLDPESSSVTFQQLYTLATSVVPTLTVNQIAYVNSLLVAVDSIQEQVSAAETMFFTPTGLNNPYTIEVNYSLVDPTDTTTGGSLVNFVGKATVVLKASGESNSCLDDDCIFLMYSGAQVVSVCPPL